LIPPPPPPHHAKVGKFSNASSGEACLECPAGTFNQETSATACADCPLGKLSSEERNLCKDCLAGEYAYQSLEVKKVYFGRIKRGLTEGLTNHSLSTFIPMFSGFIFHSGALRANIET